MAYRRRETSSEFVLNVQVPVQNIRALRILLHISIPNDVRVEAHARSSIAQCCGTCADNLEWSRRRRIQSKYIRQRQHIENAKPAAHSRFPILKRIPGKPNSCFEAFVSGIPRDKNLAIPLPPPTLETQPPARSTPYIIRA